MGGPLGIGDRQARTEQIITCVQAHQQRFKCSARRASTTFLGIPPPPYLPYVRPVPLAYYETMLQGIYDISPVCGTLVFGSPLPSLSSPHQLLDIRHSILNYPLYFLFPPPFCSVLDLLTGEMRAKFLSLPQSLISTSSFSL